MPQMSPMMWDTFILVNIFNLFVLLIFLNFYSFDMSFKKGFFGSEGKLLKVYYKW